MFTNENERPDTIAEMLTVTVKFLDLLDQAVSKMAELQGTEPYIPAEHHGMQDDLEKLAEFFKQYPMADKAMHRSVFYEAE